MEARAIQRTVRQSARKMRLVVDLIRGRPVPEAYAILRYSKKLAAKHIHKVLKSAVANAQQAAQRQNAAFDAEALHLGGDGPRDPDSQADEPRGDPRGGGDARRQARGHRRPSPGAGGEA